MYRHLSEGSGHLPTDWTAREIAQLDNLQGDIGQFGDRIAAARTWTYIAPRPDCLAATGEWPDRTRALEERLSGSRPECLSARFVDPPTLCKRDCYRQSVSVGGTLAMRLIHQPTT